MLIQLNSPNIWAGYGDVYSPGHLTHLTHPHLPHRPLPLPSPHSPWNQKRLVLVEQTRNMWIYG
jgi:hypothetical protein